MSVTVTLEDKVKAVETFGDFADSNDATVTHILNDTQVLNPSSTVPVTMKGAFTVTLSGGVATIALRAFPKDDDNPLLLQDGNGLKVQVAKFKNPASNAGDMTITFGASTPYLLGGSAFKWILKPGQHITVFGNDATPDVSNTLKSIDVAGAGTETLQVFLALG